MSAQHKDWLSVAYKHGYSFPDGRMTAFVEELTADLRACIAKQDKRIAEMEKELAEWRKLRDPAALHHNLLRGEPARLPARELLHIAGYTQSEVDAALAAAQQPMNMEPTDEQLGAMAVIEAARRLVKCKGRYHAELNYKALVEALDRLKGSQ
jgi:hypothetical protein